MITHINTHRHTHTQTHTHTNTHKAPLRANMISMSGASQPSISFQRFLSAWRSGYKKDGLTVGHLFPNRVKEIWAYPSLGLFRSASRWLHGQRTLTGYSPRGPRSWTRLSNATTTTTTDDADFPGGSNSKESARNTGDSGSIPGSGRPPREGNDNPLQYSCLENSTDRGAWWATVHGITKSQTQLSD